MSRWIAALTLALLSAMPGLAQDANPSPPPVLTQESARHLMDRVVDGFIRPGYRGFAGKSGELTTAMANLCATPSVETQASARKAFAAAATAWGTIEIVRVGPVLDKNRFERILFYPDRKGTGLRQVQALLAQPDESATSPEGLRDKSVAMQGLGALEFVLYGAGAEVLTGERNSFRCRYGLAVAGSVERVANELVAVWDDPAGVQKDWKNPGPDSATFRTGNEAITEALGILVHAAEAVRDQRIESFYKGESNNTFPKQALFWRSGLTFPMLVANLQGIRSLLDTSGFRDLLNEDQRSVVSSIDFVLKQLVRVGGGVNADVEVAVSDPKERQKLDFLLLNSRDLILRLSDNLGGGLGLGAGFSFADGD
ncbi:hypothetical protein SAMN05880590_11212 [Rhizobium sp. RU35A]|uniref:imelysin family protein n=1 Tax=Rhizobium sp. RU35A TaxID=1907414 RepID=UPI0009548033|nr:imelysin family protein [Rhizobium sp. RU35A]SIR11431.1 hypothetical protein SAMN05880590_11212 [Rhizobium sp. RU35A]